MRIYLTHYTPIHTYTHISNTHFSRKVKSETHIYTYAHISNTLYIYTYVYTYIYSNTHFSGGVKSGSGSVSTPFFFCQCPIFLFVISNTCQWRSKKRQWERQYPIFLLYFFLLYLTHMSVEE